MAKRRKVVGWTQQPSPKQLGKGSGWLGELSEVFVDKDKKYCIMIREINTDMGRVSHMTLRNSENNNIGADIPWIEKQRIKNEIFGQEVAAIEVFPKESELVDSAMMYHLWILHDFTLPFGIE